MEEVTIDLFHTAENLAPTITYRTVENIIRYRPTLTNKPEFSLVYCFDKAPRLNPRSRSITNIATKGKKEQATTVK